MSAGTPGSGARPRPLRILVFNDSADVLGTLMRWFEIHGHTVRSAQLSDLRNAYDESIAMIRTQRPDVIVFDVGLAYLPNWDFLQALRQTPSLQGFPFVLTTPNKTVLEELVDEPTNAIELVGRQEDLTTILRAVERAAEVLPG